MDRRKREAESGVGTQGTRYSPGRMFERLGEAELHAVLDVYLDESNEVLSWQLYQVSCNHALLCWKRELPNQLSPLSRKYIKVAKAVKSVTQKTNNHTFDQSPIGDCCCNRQASTIESSPPRNRSRKSGDSPR